MEKTSAGPLRVLFSVGFWTVFALICIAFLFIAVTLWLVTFPFDRQRRINHYFSCFWGHVFVVLFPGWRLRVSGRRNIDRRQSYVMVANHTSLGDIPFLFSIYRQFKWVSKASVFKTPVLGWNMWLCRYIPLVRSNAASIAAMMETCREWLRAKMSVMMFPEGTRSVDGQLQPFKHGAFTLAHEVGCAVVPIAIHGGHEVMPKHQQTLAPRARIHVEILEPMFPADYGDVQSFSDAVHARIRLALGQVAA
ncbi:MAG: 1-acyl-sn-glycerol-3-phosphate acyltransferase [Myxococcales bacterium]|nr:1-acyl-sn-glycerol-3-phosphate acyltransferase [Myxococcales bacterium]